MAASGWGAGSAMVPPAAAASAGILAASINFPEQSPTMSLSAQARGVYAIAPTPFQPDGSIDRESLSRMCDFYMKAGVTGITVLGQLGEAPKLDHSESISIVRDFASAAPTLRWTR